MSDVAEFLKARLDEDEAMARAADVKQGDPEWFATHHLGGHTVRSKRNSRPTARVQDLAGDDERDLTGILDGRAVSEHIARHDPARVLREVEAKRAVLAFHEQWPVLTQTPPEFEAVDSGDINQMAYRMSQRMEWLTTQEYVAKFGHEPPTAPMLIALAAVYADHPEYRDEWRAPIA